MTATIDAHEIINVAVFNILGAYLHTETDEDVTMIHEGVLTELMVKLYPSLYRKYATVNSKGKSLLYVKLHKSLCVLLRSALFLYKKW